ncbi:MAG: hypothetical protein ACJAYE_001312 [Candidatus Azotimanducaceae bacterium]|jgi:hypothetical protein
MTKDYDQDTDTGNDTRIGADDADYPDSPIEQAQPAQIPLLDDVVFNTELPFSKPKSRPRAKPPVDENAPRATDLFGGSAETARSGPLSKQYEAEDVDATTKQARTQTDRVVDHLVAEYSHEIVERLRDELTAVLVDLKQGQKQEPTNKPD